MSSNNIIVSTLASAFIAYAIEAVTKNFWYAVVSAIIGIAAWCLYDYLP